MKSIYPMLLFLVVSNFVNGQDITVTPLIWQVSKLEDFNANSSMDYQCTFVTDGTTAIEWNQKANYNTNLAVVNITGTWVNVVETGKVTYEIRMEGDPGTLIFEKTPVGTFITLDVSQTNAAHIKYRFTVSQVSKK